MENKNTKNDFIIAFWNLYEKKRIEKISIRELCDTAGYNRTTFYSYFSDIYDLLNQAIVNLISPIANNIIHIQDLKSLIDFNSIKNIFLNFFNKNDRYIKIIFKNNHEYILEDKAKEILRPIFKEKLINTTDSSTSFQYIIEYQISAIFGVLKFWFQDEETKLSEEKLAQILFDISTQGVFLTLIKNCKETLNIPLNHDKEIIDNIIDDLKNNNC
jgi:AcrR family transcriptional regulator